MVRPLAESTSAIKIAFLFLIIIVVIFLVGFSTPHWTVISDLGLGVASTGLWETCYEVYYLGSVCSASSIGAGTLVAYCHSFLFSPFLFSLVKYVFFIHSTHTV